MTLDPLIGRYITDRRRRDEITKLTARNIRHHLDSFSASFGHRHLDQLGRRAVERFVETMAAQGIAHSTQNLRLSSLRGFSTWLVRHRVIERDFMTDAPTVHRPRQIPRDMTNEHALAVIAAARTTRERLIGWLMFGAGLRCVEVSRLDVEDYEPAGPTLFVTGKGGRQRFVPVTSRVVAAIDSYLCEAGHGCGAMIRREDGSARRLGPERVSGIVGRMVRDAGVKIRRYDGRSAHGLRAAAASDLFDVCLDARVVQEFLGHANLQTTSVYLRRSSVERIRAAQMARLAAPLAAA